MIVSHLWPTTEQIIPVGSDQPTNIVIDNLTVGVTYRVSVYLDVDNPTTGALCQLRSGNGSSQPISASQRVAYDFTATATSHGISVSSSGCDRVRILNGVCVDTADWDALGKYGLPGNYFNGDTMPRIE